METTVEAESGVQVMVSEPVDLKTVAAAEECVPACVIHQQGCDLVGGRCRGP